jgi:hypothetical protein
VGNQSNLSILNLILISHSPLIFFGGDYSFEAIRRLSDACYSLLRGKVEGQLFMHLLAIHRCMRVSVPDLRDWGWIGSLILADIRGASLTRDKAYQLIYFICKRSAIIS